MICKEVSDRIRGCLLGGAAGDALGYPVEFLWIDDIRKRYGPCGIQRYDFDGRTGKDKGRHPAFTRVGAVCREAGQTVLA